MTKVYYPMAMNQWNREKSSQLYGVEQWGARYLRINDKGHIEVMPQGPDGKTLDLFQLVGDLKERGIRLPTLIRFPQLVKSQIDLISACFARSIAEYEYTGKYTGVYPIKVNQQRHLVEEIVHFGNNCGLGLECGSKPELLICLALMEGANSLLICNGFKDDAYIEMALLSRKLGHQTVIVVDRMAELGMIVEAAQRIDVRPIIGFRTKLHSLRIEGSGRWAETGGSKSKFGLTPSEIVEGVKFLKENQMIDTLQLLHFHIGSQIPSIQSVKTAMKEGARFFTEIYHLGAPLTYFDVGGGLGVDYDGSGHSDSSTNYSVQEYANDVVSITQSICDEKSVPHPYIVSESGRFLVAHSSMLVFDVLGRNKVTRGPLNFKVTEKDSRLVQDLNEMLQTVHEGNINEFYNDLIEKKRDTKQLFSYGVLSLEQRAKAEDLAGVIIEKMSSLAKKSAEDEEIYWSLQGELSETYFCNFSVFQSLPDSWALGQHFPVMPIHRLNESPDHRATLADLSCDSDGKIDTFIDIDGEGPQKYLEVHKLKENEPYYIAVFMTGAYQETLGDLHNLFGDTDAVHITLKDKGYSVDHYVRGDSVTKVLGYVQYYKSQLVEHVRRASEEGILNRSLSREEARLLLNHYEEGLSGYTYLEEDRRNGIK